MISNRHTLYNRYKRDKESVRFYNSKEWKICRERILIKYHYLCQDCLDNKIIKAYDVVDHIKPLRDYPELGLVEDNLKPLCHACHNSKDVRAVEVVNKRVNTIEIGASREIT